VGIVRPREIVDLAAGASRRIRPLLDAMLAAGHGNRCALVDRDAPLLVASVRRLAADYPKLDIRGAVDSPSGAWPIGRGGGRLLLISTGADDGPDPAALPGLLARTAAGMEPDDTLLLSLDLGSDPERLARACADPAGMAAAFHRNLLEVLNHRFGSDFDPGSFDHEVAWDPARAWLETRLRPRAPAQVRLGAAGLVLALHPDRPLCTGRVGTWTRTALRAVAEPASLLVTAWLTDPDALRGLVLLRRK
jgi:L-histidine N-alpha-methyltransferase